MTNAGEWRTPEEMFWYPLAPRQSPRVPPTSGIFDNPTRCIAVNVEWWSHISGVIDLLSDPDAWTGTDEEKALAEYNINRLLGEENCMLQDIRVVDCILEKLEDGVWIEIADLSDCGGGGGGGSILPHILEKELGAVRTTTSTTEVLVTGSNIPFTPSKPNMKVKYRNICANNSGANQTYVGVRFNGVAGSNPVLARTFGTTFTFLQTSAIFEGLTVGVEHDLSLYWKVSAGTGSMSNVVNFIIEITEYDDTAEDLDFVQHIRIQGRELQEQINGSWNTVDESLADYLNAIEDTADTALSIANTATTVNGNQATEIDAIQALNATQNTRLDDLEDFQEDAELSFAGINGSIVALDNRLDIVEARLEGLDFGGVWAWQHDLLSGNGGYVLGTAGLGWTSGSGWKSNASGLQIVQTGVAIYENQISHIEVTLQYTIAPATVTAVFDVNSGDSGHLHYNGLGVDSVGWYRLPNRVGSGLVITFPPDGTFWLTKLRYLGRGTDVPFA